MKGPSPAFRCLNQGLSPSHPFCLLGLKQAVPRLCKSTQIHPIPVSSRITDGAELLHTKTQLCRGRRLPFLEEYLAKKIYLIALTCFSPTSSPVLLIPSQRCLHTRLGLQGSDVVFDILVIVSHSLSRLLARGQAGGGRNLELGRTLPFPAIEMGEGLKQEKQGGSFSLSFGGNSPALPGLPGTHTFLTRCQDGHCAACAEQMPHRGGGRVPEALPRSEGNLQLPAKVNTRLRLTQPALHKQACETSSQNHPLKSIRRRTGSSSTPGLL